MSSSTPNHEVCQDCQNKELEQLKHDLNECKKRGQSKDRTIKQLNKRVFILTAVAVGIGAIFGKEALDSITEWLNSIGSFNKGVRDLSEAVVPSPSTLAVFAFLPLMAKSRRRDHG